MSIRLECSARAALCMRLATREPANRNLWMAEAEHWSRLSQESRRDEAFAEVEAGHRLIAMAQPTERGPDLSTAHTRNTRKISHDRWLRLPIRQAAGSIG
jgi:hypothetical protein